LVAVLADELSFWRSDDSAEPDKEILDAVKPALVQIPGSMLLCASSPYARRGELWAAFQRYWGCDDPSTLFWKSGSLQMNPTIPQDLIDAAYAEDPVSADAEFGGNWRSDISSFISREALERVVENGVTERPYQARHKYVSFCDPSGGASDSFVIAIGHKEGSIAFVDLVREYPAPFEPDAVIASCAQLLAAYKVWTVKGDAYSGTWVQTAFRTQRISYIFSEQTKSQIYISALPVIMNGLCSLPVNPKMTNQFVQLERKIGRAGDYVDHPKSGKDDVCNCVAGLIVSLSAAHREIDFSQLPTTANLGYAEFKRLRHHRQMRS
jgi:hypothetical protein